MQILSRQLERVSAHQVVEDSAIQLSVAVLAKDKKHDSLLVMVLYGVCEDVESARVRVVDHVVVLQILAVADAQDELSKELVLLADSVENRKSCVERSSHCFIYPENFYSSLNFGRSSSLTF